MILLPPKSPRHYYVLPYTTLFRSDSGAGMPSDVVEFATRPFWRGSDPFLRNHSGAGLGLALVNSFTTAQGATLHIDSMVGRGTTVSVVFPPAAEIGRAHV